MKPQSFHCVTRTGRFKPTAVRQQRGERPLINSDDCNQHSGGDAATSAGSNPAFINNPASSRVASIRLYFSMRRRGIRTRRHSGRFPRSSRKLSHNSRRARLRFTASRLYFLPHITPHRTFRSGAGAQTTSIPGPTIFFPSSLTWSNSDLNRSLSGFRSRFFKVKPNWKIRPRPLLENADSGSQSSSKSHEKALRGQLRPPLLATALENQTPGLGGHAGKETDTTLATAVGGLKRSFHFLFPSFYPELKTELFKLRKS